MTRTANTVRLLSLGLVVTAGLVLSACGGGSFEDKAASTTTAPADSGSNTGNDDTGSDSGGADGFSAQATSLGTELLTQFDIPADEVDELEAGCLGTALIDALGEQDAEGIATTEEPTSAQLDAVEAGFDACVSGRTLAAGLVALFFDELPGAPTADQSVISCVAGEIDGTTGQLVVGLVDSNQSGTLPTEFLDTLDVCVPDEVVADLFVGELTSSGDFDQTQATCIAERVAPELSISELAAAGQNEALPPEIQTLIETATVACLTGG